MRIQSKLIATFLPLSIVSLLVPAVLLFLQTRRTTTASQLSHLESVASIQKRRIDAILSQNLERLALVSSRTQLRLSLAAELDRADPKNRAKMNRIIADARKSILDFRHIQIATTTGEVVADTHPEHLRANLADEEIFRQGLRAPMGNTLYREDDGPLMLKLSGPLRLKGKLLGVVVIDSTAETIVSAMLDRTGLGETGETVIAQRTQDGGAMFMAPLRFDSDGAMRRTINGGANEVPMIRILNGARSFVTRARDYRGEPVLAAGRHIDGADWGLVAKIDEEEAFAGISEAYEFLIALVLSVALLNALLSVWASRPIARPIDALTTVAQSLSKGDFSVRADTRSAGEVGVLAATFNEMVGRIEARTRDLNEQNEQLQLEIKERTQAQEALTHSENQLSGIIQIVGNAIVSIDASHRIILFNKKAEEIFGYSNEEALGQNIEVLIPSRYRKSHKRKVAQFSGSKNSEGLMLNPRIFGLRKHGDVFPAEASVSRLETHGRVIYTVALSDVSERRASDLERERFVAELKRRHAELERFTYAVSHDLKSPIVTIQGFLTFLEKDIALEDEVRVKKDIARISAAAQQMKRLLDDLLELSRVGRIVRNPTLVDGNLLAREAADVIATEVAAGNINLVMGTDFGTIFGERDRLLEVFQNLLANAAKFMGDQENPSITVASRTDAEEKVYYVQDNGIGIEPEYRERVFELFERLDPAIDGSGVGLSLVKKIIETHRGRVWVEANEGGGCRVCFTVKEREG